MIATLSPALESRHRAAVAESERAAAAALSFAKLGRLRSCERAQPMPPGSYECWATSAGLSIVHVGPAGMSGERAVTQIYPPTRA